MTFRAATDRGLTVAIASGKGGTGKTTVAVNLARVMGGPALLLDCDVEGPNAHLFLGAAVQREAVIELPIPVVDEDRCDGCAECGRFCQYHAIISFGATAMVFPDLCHSCGGCMRVCPHGAITEVGRRIGVVRAFQDDNVELIQGCLDIGVPLAPPLIRAVKAQRQQRGLTLIDAPPGTSCPVVAAVHGADYAVLVSDSTPFGLHDLTLAAGTLGELGIPFGVVVNRSGLGDGRLYDYCANEHIAILAEIPDDRRIAEAYSRGHLIVEAIPAYRALFERLLAEILRQTVGGADHVNL